ncbi:sigma-70 family RNA polymerase sigma factor [Streptacidiphilus sp. N1-3]|uniref:Sigma-70 family RNA polymerase sigma factor n=1 Tax=Streptacidiphilus alkalitolerans TaxID=3342712 RepID=A0ABV6X654_9ACTN
MTQIPHNGYDGPRPPRAQAAAVRAAQQGDQRALDQLVADYLPLIYNIVGRALDAPGDTDDVVQETMLQMIRDVRKLRDPEAFRSWLVAIAMRQVRGHWRARRSAPDSAGIQDLQETALLADPGADFVDLTITTLNLSGQRRETAEATRWLDADDRQLLSLWWMEVAGQLTRTELAVALELPPPKAAVRIQRMKAQLEISRTVVRALHAVPRCQEADAVLRDWDGRPAGLWRKRIARHVRTCPTCGGVPAEMVPVERLLANFALVPVPPVLLALALTGAGGVAHHSATAATHARSGAARTGRAASRSASRAASRAGGISLGKAAVLSGAALALVGATAAYALAPSSQGRQHRTAGTATPAAVRPSSVPPPSTTPSATATTAKPSATPSHTAAAPKAAAIVNTRLPLRAAFYYPWYPENFSGGGSKYTPSAGKYSVDVPSTVDRQIKDMQYAGLQAGISSWWGVGKREDKRLPLLMSEGAKLGFSWTVYYENEAYGDPTAAQIRSDLVYLRKYSGQKTWLHIDGKPVIFVYGGGDDGCGMATRWAQANKTEGYYVVLKVFGNYLNCADQPQGWHQYASSLDIQKGYSAILSPGFWKNDQATPSVPRDLTRFRKDATTVATSGEPFQLLVTYNEWGEGTAAESSTDWPSASGHGAYMDILHQVFTAHPR